MKEKIKKMMNYLQFIRYNNIVVTYYYIHKANELFKMRFIAPRPLWHEWKSIVNDFEMGYISPREMYQQSLNSARRYKLA